MPCWCLQGRDWHFSLVPLVKRMHLAPSRFRGWKNLFPVSFLFRSFRGQLPKKTISRNQSETKFTSMLASWSSRKHFINMWLCYLVKWSKEAFISRNAFCKRKTREFIAFSWLGLPGTSMVLFLHCWNILNGCRRILWGNFHLQQGLFRCPSVWDCRFGTL